MTGPFSFSGIPEIIFGCGKMSLLPGIISKRGRSVLLLTGENSLIVSGKMNDIKSSISDTGASISVVSVSGEPSPEMIDIIVEGCKDSMPDVVLAIGGGSVVDAGKAVAAMLKTDGRTIDFLEGVGTRKHAGDRLPFIAVPTTAGTGSEATKNAVLSRTGKEGFKRSLRHENFVPDIALVDPQMTISCPPGITAASGMDCFTQLVEAYLSNASSPITDALALRGIQAVKSGLMRAVENGDDIDARSDMSLAALLSGICLANAGLGVVHGFASSIGSLYNIPHGNICGILMLNSNKITLRKLKEDKNNPAALIKYSGLGRVFSDEPGKSDDYYADSFIAQLAEMTVALRLPSLSDLGVDRNDLGTIVRTTEGKNNPVKLSADEIEEILLLSL